MSDLIGKKLKLAPNGQTWVIVASDFVRIETLDGLGVRYLRREDAQMLASGAGTLTKCPTCWGHGYTIGTCACSAKTVQP